MNTNRRRNWGATAVGICLITLGGVLLTAGATIPDTVESAWGTVRAITVTAPQRLTGALPEISLGASGTAKELDACDGTFTRMLEYRNPDAPPVWAAHNNCGGDTILPWAEGQQFRVDGALYIVVDIRHLPKFTSTPDDLAGLDGEIAFQTCLYGKPVMAFVGADRVPENR